MYSEYYCNNQLLEESLIFITGKNHRTHIRAMESYELQNNAYVICWHLSLSLTVSLPSPAFHYLHPDLSGIHHCHTGGESLRDRRASWETVSQTLHDKVSASQDLTSIKTTHPTRDFSFTKAHVLGTQGSTCQQRHPKFQWKLSCCGIQHTKHQKQGNYCWHNPPLCHKHPVSIRAVSVTEKNKRNA